MNIISTVGLAFSSIIEHPLRSALTSLGIIIGVASVYAMLAFGDAAKAQVEESLNSISSRTMQVWPDWNRRRSSQSRPQMPFTEQDAAEMRNIPGVIASTGNLQGSNATIATDTNDVSGNALGVDADYLKALGNEILLGENITYADIEQKAPVAVISDGVHNRLFEGQNPIGQTIKVNNVSFIVKGVVTKADNNISFGNDDIFAWVPLPLARDRITGGNPFVRNHVSSLRVVGQLGADLNQVEDEMDVILRRSRDIKSGAPPDYRIFSSRAWRQQAADSTKTLSYILAAMGGISLIVGGVGVMNIMLVSVSERTREIGLRMAVGAKGSTVLIQFLTEALLLCAISGVIGLLIGFGVFKVTVDILKLTFNFNPNVALLAFSSSLIIGLLFGFLPARRASRLNPIQALRHD